MRIYSNYVENTNSRFNYIKVIISYSKYINGKKINIQDYLKLKGTDNLENAFKEYKKRKNIRNIHNSQNTFLFLFRKRKSIYSFIR